MSFQVDQCKNFKDGKVCSKCGRMMPALCKDQQDLEEKAKKYDEWVASQGVVETVAVVEQEASSVEGLEEEQKVPAPLVSPKPKGRPRRHK